MMFKKINKMSNTSCYYCAQSEGASSSDAMMQPCRCYTLHGIYTHTSCFQRQRQASLKVKRYDVSLLDLLTCSQCQCRYTFQNQTLQTVAASSSTLTLTTVICTFLLAIFFGHFVIKCQLSFITSCMALTVYCALLFHSIIWAVGRYTLDSPLPLTFDAVFSFSANNILILITALQSVLQLAQKSFLASLPISGSGGLTDQLTLHHG